ncbi:MAG: aldolase/citrate lyase family protein, partial [Thermoanaerobaculia bacterium]|nr:aldolase/citrate lyase family protein [Thermoanaerobaculia bacterium]
MMAKAAGSDADLVFLDLEDAVAPQEKEKARSLAVEALNGLEWKPPTVAVRVNDAETRWAYEDVITVVEGAGERIDLLILPKV